MVLIKEGHLQVWIPQGILIHRGGLLPMESCTGSCSAHNPHLHPMPTPGSTPPAVNRGQPLHCEILSYWVITCLLVHALPWTLSITLGFGKGWVRQEEKGMARRYWPVSHENPTRCYLPVLLGSLLASPPAPRPPPPAPKAIPPSLRSQV